MQNTDTSWIKNADWKARYTKLYSTSTRRNSVIQDDTARITFMSNDTSGYSPLTQLRSRVPHGSLASGNTILAEQSDLYDMSIGKSDSLQADNLGGHDTMLLDMVRAHSKEQEEAKDETLHLPGDDVSDDQLNEACVHGLGLLGLRPVTERSVSRSRFSRISTRRDMDIPSILAFQTNIDSGAAPAHIGLPTFNKVKKRAEEDIPRWSIRRSVCPVCSQKWKDRSEVIKIKSSGLKRNSTSELPSVIAPARLRAAITMAYVPRPALAVVDEEVTGIGVMRNPSATWQLTRARRFRAPKMKMPPPEATAPPSAAAPLARKDLDLRVNKFLANKKK